MAEKNFPKTTIVITVDIQPVDDCEHRMHYLRDSLMRLLEDHLKYMSRLYEGDRGSFTTPDTDVRWGAYFPTKEGAAFVGKSDLLRQLAIDRGIPIITVKIEQPEWEGMKEHAATLSKCELNLRYVDEAAAEILATKKEEKK